MKVEFFKSTDLEHLQNKINTFLKTIHPIDVQYNHFFNPINGAFYTGMVVYHDDDLTVPEKGKQKEEEITYHYEPNDLMV